VAASMAVLAIGIYLLVPALIGLAIVVALASPGLILFTALFAIMGFSIETVTANLITLTNSISEAVGKMPAFVSSLQDLAEISNLAAVREEIEGIVTAINGVVVDKAITFTTSMQELAAVGEMSGVVNARAAAGVSQTVEHVVAALNQTGGDTNMLGRPSARAAAATVKNRYPIVLKVDGKEMSDWVLEVVGGEAEAVNE